MSPSVASILQARVLAIACGYEDANDLSSLRTDPAFKLARGRLPDTGAFSQPTLSRWENAPDLKAVILDIDDTFHEVHGTQQLSPFDGQRDARCSLPVHIYDIASARFGRHDPATWQGADWQAGDGISAPALKTNPPPLAQHPPDDPWGWTLWSPRSQETCRRVFVFTHLGKSN